MRTALFAALALGLAGVVVVLAGLGRVLGWLLRRRERPPVASPPPQAALGGRLVLVLGAAGALAGAVFTVTLALPILLERQHFPMPPGQPIAFSHQVHVEEAGLDCAFCHRTAAIGDSAGLPDLQQCMFCHLVVEGDGPRAAQIERVQNFWTDRSSIEWVRIHRLPDHSRFPHEAHVQAGVPCATCHGQVEQMDVPNQVRSLKMSDCVACHQDTSAPTDCVACHY